MKSVRQLFTLLGVTLICCSVDLLGAALISVLVAPAVGARFSASPRLSGGHSPSAEPTTTAGQQQTTKSDATTKPKRKLDADLSGFDVSDDKSGKRVSAMLGGSRSAAVPSATLLAPRRAKFYGASADFLWSFSGHSDGYVLLITDEDETQIVRQQLNAPRYRFDAPLAKLQPGETYFWRVQVLPNTLASDPLEFVVVSADERQAIDRTIAGISDRDPYQAALARARIFMDHRLWFDALGAYSELTAKYPDRPEPYEERGAIYAQIPVTKSLADADLARAAQLRK